MTFRLFAFLLIFLSQSTAFAAPVRQEQGGTGTTTKPAAGRVILQNSTGDAYTSDAAASVNTTTHVVTLGTTTMTGDTTWTSANPVIPGLAVGSFPAAGTAGRLQRATDSGLGLYMDNGTQWLSLSGNVVNAKEMGAVGDGVTNDSTALQNAINASAGKTLYIPPGTYKLNTHLNLVSNLKIQCAGIGVTILKIAEAGVVSALTSSATNNIEITGCEITSTNDNTGQQGINVSGQRIFIHHNYVHDFQLHGISITTSNYYNVSDNLITNTDSDGNQAGAAIFSSFEGAGYGVVNNNVVWNCGGGIGMDAGTATGPGVESYSVTMNNNVVDNTTSACISVAGSHSATIVGNVLTRCGQRETSNLNYAIAVAQDNAVAHALGQRVVIDGNTLEGASYSSIQIQGTQDVTITNNIIKDSGMDSPPPSVAYGINLATGTSGADNTRGIISGNLFECTAPCVMTAGVLAANAINYLMYGNLIKGQVEDLFAHDISAVDTVHIGPNYDVDNDRMWPTGFRGYVDNADHTVTGTTNETTLATWTIPATLLGTRGKVRIKAVGQLTGTNNTKTIILRAGAVMTPITAAAGDTSDWIAEFEMDNTSVTTQRWDFVGYLGATVDVLGYTTGSSNTAAALGMTLSGTLANGADSIVLKKLTVDVVR